MFFDYHSKTKQTINGSLKSNIQNKCKKSDLKSVHPL